LPWLPEFTICGAEAMERTAAATASTTEFLVIFTSELVL
jgi:hypothetical protein